MKILYLTSWDFTHKKTDGVCKKIEAQIKVLKESGYTVDILAIEDGRVVYRKDSRKYILGKVGKFKKITFYICLSRHLKKFYYDAVYNRYGLMDLFYYNVLKSFHKRGAKVLLEIPTFPYTGECPKGILNRVMFGWDKWYQDKLKKVVYRIITYSQDIQIFGIPAIQISNGIDVEEIPPRTAKVPHPDSLSIIAVANVMDSHGYDRVIRGISKYYKSNGQKKISFHIVGNGESIGQLRAMVNDLQISDHVIFHGPLYGKELDEIYNQCEIGAESLGDHRKGLFLSSSLKAREYAAKGLPFITSCDSDVFENEFFVYKAKADDSAVDMEDVLNFINQLYHEYGQVNMAFQIRERTKLKCDIRKTMEPVVQCMEGIGKG